ncbi:hypothetical protein GVAV_001650 [Gurleya vavrai]
MKLTFYILSVIGSYFNTCPSDLSYKEIKIQDIKKTEIKHNLCTGEDFNQNTKVLTDENLDKFKTSVFLQDLIDPDPFKLLENLLNNLEIATNEICKEIFKTFFLKSLILPDINYTIGRVKHLPKDENLDDYLKNTIDENYKKNLNKVQKDNQNVNKETLKTYNDAYSIYVSAKNDYLNLLKTPKTVLKNIDLSFNKGPINIKVHDLLYPDLNKYPKGFEFEITFENKESAVKFIKFVCIDLDMCKDYKKLEDVEFNFIKNTMLKNTFLKYKIESEYVNSLYFKEKHVFNNLQDKISSSNQVNILNAVINYFNNQNLEFLEKNKFLSVKIYEKLKILITNMNEIKVYKVKAKGCNLNLNFDRSNSQ